MMFNETVSLKRENKYCQEGDEDSQYYQDNDMSPYLNSQGRIRLTYQDPNFTNTSTSIHKKMKFETPMSDYTPKRALDFNKEDRNGQDDQYTEDYHTQMKKSKTYSQYVTPFAPTEKKKTERLDITSEFTPSPERVHASGRAKRNVKPCSQFNPAEYELTK